MGPPKSSPPENIFDSQSLLRCAEFLRSSIGLGGCKGKPRASKSAAWLRGLDVATASTSGVLNLRNSLPFLWGVWGVLFVGTPLFGVLFVFHEGKTCMFCCGPLIPAKECSGKSGELTAHTESLTDFEFNSPKIHPTYVHVMVIL